MTDSEILDAVAIRLGIGAAYQRIRKSLELLAAVEECGKRLWCFEFDGGMWTVRAYGYGTFRGLSLPEAVAQALAAAEAGR